MLTESPDTPEDLVALVGSRLCHDLISPLGAIGNGVELLTMTAATPSPELQLISESVAAANARVKFFRLAFGRTGEQRVGRPEMAALMREISGGSRIHIDWRAEGDHAREAAKLVCLAILCIEPAMPRGGEITVDFDPQAAPAPWTIRGTTRLTRYEPDLWGNLDGKPTNVTPAQVQFALLPRSAALLGRTPQWEVTETGAMIRF